jgi:hypothetical protein
VLELATNANGDGVTVESGRTAIVTTPPKTAPANQMRHDRDQDDPRPEAASRVHRGRAAHLQADDRHDRL